MGTWIASFQPQHELYVRRSHTVVKAFDSSSMVYLYLRPLLVTALHGMLNRLLAQAAFQAFTNLIDIYGVGEFRFEVCENGAPLGEVTNYFI